MRTRFAPLVVICALLWSPLVHADLPRFDANSLKDINQFAAFLRDFFQNDKQAAQLLNRSNTDLFAQGHRPSAGVPNPPEPPGQKIATLDEYFVRKLFLDLGKQAPFRKAPFRKFLTTLERPWMKSMICAGEMSIKYKLALQGSFVFETELQKVPAGEREKFKRCWITEAILGTELRVLGWVHYQIFGTRYEPPQ